MRWPCTCHAPRATGGSAAELPGAPAAVTFASMPELTGSMSTSTPPNPSDAAVVRRVLGGDVEAFSLLVDRYHPRALKVATAVLGDPDDAEDAVQEAFVRVYRALASYTERERFGAWLMRIVINQSRTRATRRRRWSSAGTHLDGIDTLADPAAPPGDALSQREELAHALAQLGADQREAVVLRFAEELSYEEMAAVTGVGVSALKMRVQRACARLRSLLSENLHV